MGYYTFFNIFVYQSFLVLLLRICCQRKKSPQMYSTKKLEGWTPMNYKDKLHFDVEMEIIKSIADG